MNYNGHYFSHHHPAVLQRIVNDQTKLYKHQKKALLTLLNLAETGYLDPCERQPQAGAALLLSGVGSGKTIIAQTAGFLLGPWMQGPQILILVDNCTLRSRVLQDFPTHPKSHSPIYEKWELYNLNILAPGTPPPKIAELKAEDRSYAFAIQEADILVINRQLCVSLVKLGIIQPENIGLIAVDEAHHAFAGSYRTILNYFNQSMLIYVTGSKFRGDNEMLPHVQYNQILKESESGKMVRVLSPQADFEYTIQTAWKETPPLIKPVAFCPTRSDGYIVVEDQGVEIKYTPEDFFEKAENDRQWFRQCLLADSFCLPVLQQAVEILRQKRAGGLEHAMIVRGLSIAHTNRLGELLESYFPDLKKRVGVIHSDLDCFDKEGRASITFEKFLRGEYIVLVHCGSVGEGFNHKLVSVSVILGVIRTLQRFEQEIGRSLRRISTLPDNESSPKNNSFPKHSGLLSADNMAVVVTHESLQLDTLFSQFTHGLETVEVSDEKKSVQSRELDEPYQAGDELLVLTTVEGLEVGDTLRVQVKDTNGIAKPHEIQVQQILDDFCVKITPLEINIPAGAAARKASKPADIEEPAEFKQHLGLDLWIYINGEYTRLTDYKRQIILSERGMREGKDGLISTGDGIPLNELLPAGAYELFLRGLEQEIATKQIVPPLPQTPCRPDLQQQGWQDSYGKQIRSAIARLLAESRIIPDGRDGCSLINRPVEAIAHVTKIEGWQEVQDRIRNNSSLLHYAIFAHLKEVMHNRWSEYGSEADYRKAVAIAQQKLQEIRTELYQSPLLVQMVN